MCSSIAKRALKTRGFSIFRERLKTAARHPFGAKQPSHAPTCLRRVPVNDAGKPARMVLTDRELLDTPSPTLSPHRAHHSAARGCSTVRRCRAPRPCAPRNLDRQLAVPVRRGPDFGMACNPATHPKRQRRLQIDALLAAVVPQHAQGRALRTAQPGRPVDVPHRRGRDDECAAARVRPNTSSPAPMTSSTACELTHRSPFPQARSTRKCAA